MAGYRWVELPQTLEIKSRTRRSSIRRISDKGSPNHRSNNRRSPERRNSRQSSPERSNSRRRSSSRRSFEQRIPDRSHSRRRSKRRNSEQLGSRQRSHDRSNRKRRSSNLQSPVRFGCRGHSSTRRSDQSSPGRRSPVRLSADQNSPGRHIPKRRSSERHSSGRQITSQRIPGQNSPGRRISSSHGFHTAFDDMRDKMQIFLDRMNFCNCPTGSKDKLAKAEKGLRVWKLQMCGTEEEMREVAGRICRNYLHGAWKSVKPSELIFRRISGGLSNFLYYVALPDDATKLGGYLRRENSPDAEPDAAGIKFPGKSMGRLGSFSIEEPTKVLLRIYGQVHGERAMDAIVTESVIFTLLSERRLGPKLHGVFSGGRIEEYIPARPLLTRELAEPALSMKIAEKMAAIHSMDVPLSKEPNWLWKTMAKWLRTVRSERLTKYAIGKNEEEEEIIKRLKTVDFENEIEWLKKFIASIESPVVFCHNDLQEGNILLLEDIQPTTEDDISADYVQTYSVDAPQSDKENNHTRLEPLAQFEDTNTSDSVTSHISDSGEPKLVLIDFEYCAYNYRGFDIANHFQEWAYDYTNPEPPFYYENQENWPNLEQKEIFIKEYLKHYFTSPSESKEPSIDDINQLLTEVEAFALASHLFWSLWSIVNASKSQIPFGYWEYGLSRVETYLRLKQEVIKKEKFGFPQKRKICEVDI